MQIYLARNNVQAGPYTLDQVNAMLASGEVLLEDLVWHEGMEAWRSIGEMTNGQLVYLPNGSTTSTQLQNQSQSNNQQQGQQSVSVDRLYGNTNSTINSVNLQKSTHATMTNGDAELTNEIASIGSRILAIVIDQAIIIAAILPMLIHSGLSPFIQDNNGSMAEIQVQAQQLAESVPQHITLLVGFMLLAILIIQVVMLIRRGQTLGKLVTGIRILDHQSNRLPSVTNIILLRTIVTNIAYSIPGVGTIFVLVDAFMMLIDKQHRSLHDKFAKTYVVKADNSQLANNGTGLNQ